MNQLDKQYTDLLQDILDNGVEKSDRTGTGTLSVFGRQIRHKMSDGFPLLTTKKMAWKTMVTELIWFLRGDTNIKFLVDNGCHIWNGDAYKRYQTETMSNSDYKWLEELDGMNLFTGEKEKVYRQYNPEKFINKIKTDDEFAKKWGSLGKIYGHQWRSWDKSKELARLKNAQDGTLTQGIYDVTYIDQISELIKQIKENPDSRRMVVSAWAVHDLPNMVLPPCHYSFQVYTRELSLLERVQIYGVDKIQTNDAGYYEHSYAQFKVDEANIPKRAISLMWNQRSVDTFLGLPFNIASYGLLLEIIATTVNMVPDELIGNLGDCHLYLNHIEQAREQIGRELSLEERKKFYEKEYNNDVEVENDHWLESKLRTRDIPKRTREPFPLPKLNINTEFWQYEGGECGVGPIDAVAVFNSFKNDDFCRCLIEEDIQLYNYQSHTTIKAPLSN
jgi:thymidylate synthase